MKSIFRIWSRPLCALLILMMLIGVCSTPLSAASVSSASVISTYVADFEDNYYSSLSSDTCTSGSIAEDNGSKVLDVTLNSNTQTHRFEIYNSSKGDLTLNDGKIYDVTVNYKVVRIGADDPTGATYIDLVRYTGKGNELVKVESFPESTYYPGDTTGWVTQTVIFKAGVASSPEYNRLAINVVSNSCPENKTNIEANTTSILFDNITVTECTDSTKTIEFVTNGGTYCEPILAQSGEAVTLPTPTRDLYDFGGWYTDVAFKKAFNKSTMPNDTTTKLYAKWNVAADSVTVTYVTNNGETLAPAVGRPGDELTLPTLSRSNFHFAGWYDKKYETRQELTAFPAESVTLYAKWEVIPQLCSFENPDDFPEPSGGAISKRYEITDKSAYSGKYSLYYDFWKAYPESKGKTGFARAILRNEAGEHIRVQEGMTYTVTFKYKVTGIDEPAKLGEYFGLVTSGKGSAWTSPALQMEYYDGYKYSDDLGKGWKTCTFTFTAKPLDDSSNYLSIGVGGVSQVYIDEILVYEYDKNFKYKGSGMMLCFDTQGGPMADTVYAERGTEVTLPVLEREGYRFTGWSYDPEGLEPVEGETVTLDKVYSLLYAGWYKIPPVTETPDPEPEPEPETEPEPTVQPKPEQDNSVVLYIIIVAAAVVVIAVVVVIVIVVRRTKMKNEK